MQTVIENMAALHLLDSRVLISSLMLSCRHILYSSFSSPLASSASRSATIRFRLFFLSMSWASLDILRLAACSFFF